MTIDTPTRRTFVTGQSLPAVETSYRSFNLAPGEPDSEFSAVRAFTVNVRNRASSSIYLREGADGDEIEVKPHEHYPIYEPDGIQSISLKGDSGGETVEIRVVIAHNDFNITDKIDATLRAFSQYIGTAQRDTTITGQDVDFTIDDSANIDVDVQAQTVGDIDVLDVEGRQQTMFLSDGSGSMATEETWTFMNNAQYDGFVTSIKNRVYDGDEGDMTAGGRLGVYLQYDAGSTGDFDTIIPREYASARAIYHFARNGRQAYVQRFSPGRECIWGWDPSEPIKFKAGDTLRLVYISDSMYSVSSSPYDVETTIEFVERIGQ